MRQKTKKGGRKGRGEVSITYKHTLTALPSITVGSKFIQKSRLETNERKMFS